MTTQTAAPLAPPPSATAAPPPLVDAKLVTYWAMLAAAFMLVGPVAGLLASMKLDDPDFLRNVEWLQYGRIRLVHVNGVVFGTFTPAMFALMFYAVPKLTGRPMWGVRALWTAFVAYLLAMLAGPTCLLLGYLQPIEAAEFPPPVDALITLTFVLVATSVLMTVALRRERKMYVTLWYWVAALVWTVLNFPLGNVILPNVPRGTTSAAMHGFYLHDVVGLWITPAGVGAAYYMIPVAARATLFSHRLSLIGFWGLAFFYPLNGVHHYIYSTIPDWAQTIAIASSMMLILPVWAFSVNMWGTMRGHWPKFAGPDSWVLKFSILGAVWYLITCFQGPTQALRGMQALTHFGDYNVGHAHSAVFAVFAIWAMAVLYVVVPRMAGRQLWSNRLASWHYWLQILGFAAMFASLSISGLQQGAMQQYGTSMWIDQLDAIRPYWQMRTLGGTAMDVGLALFVVNLVMTLRRGRKVPPAAAPLSAPASASAAVAGY